MWLRYSPAHTKPPSTRRNAHRAHHTHRAHHELSGSGAIVAPRRHIVTATPTEGRLRGRPGERGARRAGSGEQGGPGAGSKAGREREARRAGSGKQGGPGSGKQGGQAAEASCRVQRSPDFDPESMAGYRGRVSRTASSGGAASGSPSYPFTVPNLPL